MASEPCQLYRVRISCSDCCDDYHDEQGCFGGYATYLALPLDPDGKYSTTYMDGGSPHLFTDKGQAAEAGSAYIGDCGPWYYEVEEAIADAP